MTAIRHIVGTTNLSSRPPHSTIILITMPKHAGVMTLTRFPCATRLKMVARASVSAVWSSDHGLFVATKAVDIHPCIPKRLLVAAAAQSILGSLFAYRSYTHHFVIFEVADTRFNRTWPKSSVSMSLFPSHSWSLLAPSIIPRASESRLATSSGLSHAPIVRKRAAGVMDCFFKTIKPSAAEVLGIRLKTSLRQAWL